MFTVQYPPNGTHRGEAYLMEDGMLRFTIIHREGSMEGGLAEWVAACMEHCRGRGTDELRSSPPPAAPTRGEVRLTARDHEYMRDLCSEICSAAAREAEKIMVRHANQGSFPWESAKDAEIARLRTALNDEGASYAMLAIERDRLRKSLDFIANKSGTLDSMQGIARDALRGDK